MAGKRFTCFIVIIFFGSFALGADCFSPPLRRRASNIMSTTAKKQKLNDGDDAPPTSTPPLRPIRAGFLGCGTIASAIATSLATPGHAPHLAEIGYTIQSISVTRRSESKSTKLREDFSDIVTVYETPEEVVENSDIVFLTVLPQHVDGVLENLTKAGVWRKDEHTMISLVSTSKVEDLITKSGLPRQSVYKMICLPAIAKREGCALLQPAPVSAPAANDDDNDNTVNFDVKSMLEALGGCVVCDDDERMNTLMVNTAMMGPMYGIMRQNRDWLVKRGVPPEDASYFVGRSYLSMVQDAERGCEETNRFDALVEEQTPGGLNEQALGNLEKEGVFNSYDRAMDAVLSRLNGMSDGSLQSKP